MKAPVSFIGIEKKPARDSKYYIRKIINKKMFYAGKHKIRFRIVSEYDSNLSLDYFEFVPLHIITDPTKPEDRY